MDLGQQILSDVVSYTRYCKYLLEMQRREIWSETITRNKEMHLKRFPKLREEIEEAYEPVYAREVLPSMRSLQFGGRPIELAPNRIFNCSYLHINRVDAFHEILFLLLGGSGIGYSVQKHHVAQLPEIKRPSRRTRRFVVGDNVEGWSEAIKVLVASYFEGKSSIDFDFSDIRPRGSLLKTSGGRAPGPEPLKDAIHNVRKVLDRKTSGDKLAPIEVHDIICFIADCVRSGGIRPSALIALFSIDDEEMLAAKAGNWYEANPQRARANNSAVVVRHKIKHQKFNELWARIKASGSGEPGLFLTNSVEHGVNPCQPANATLLTPNGITTMGRAQIGDTIWSGKRWTKITNKWSTGIKPTYRYNTTAGYFLGTQNHRIVSGGTKIEVGCAKSVDIAVGPGATIDALDAQDVMDGLVIGDGTVHKASNNLVQLIIGQDDGDYHKSELTSFILKHRPGIGPLNWSVNTTITHQELPLIHTREIPTRFRVGASPAKMRGFLRGLYTANGSVREKHNRITLKAASFNLISQAREMLSALGIPSYITTNKPSIIQWENGTYTSKQSYDLNITSGRRLFHSLIGFVQEYKQKKLFAIAEYPSLHPKKTFNIQSREVVSDGEEVFDITVDDSEHTYWTGGLLVSNCAEISLNDRQMCNLTTLNAGDLKSESDFLERVRAAAFIGTLQAAYTQFHYISDKWRETTESEALLGVSMSGIAAGAVLQYDLKKAAKVAREENRRVAKLIGIKPAARITTVKPEGSSSLVMGTSSGIHAWHSKYYIRRLTINKNLNIYTYLMNVCPDLMEDDFFKPTLEAKLKIPVRAPEGAITRDESPLQLLERVKKFHKEWIQPGHRSGDNTHNVSVTVSIKPDEWDSVRDWMWANRKHYTGISVLPYDGGTYVQAPFEECSKADYDFLSTKLVNIDLSKVKEFEDNTTLAAEAACAGAGCVIT